MSDTSSWSSHSTAQSISSIAATFKIEPRIEDIKESRIGGEAGHMNTAVMRCMYGVHVFNRYVEFHRCTQNIRRGLPDMYASQAGYAFVMCADRYRRAMINERVFFSGFVYDTDWSDVYHFHESDVIFEEGRRVDQHQLNKWKKPLTDEYGYKPVRFIVEKEEKYSLLYLRTKFGETVKQNFLTDDFLLYIMACDETYGDGDSIHPEENLYEDDDVDVSGTAPVDNTGRDINWHNKFVRLRFVLLTYMKNKPDVASRRWSEVYHLISHAVLRYYKENDYFNTVNLYRLATASMLGLIMSIDTSNDAPNSSDIKLTTGYEKKYKAEFKACMQKNQHQ